MTSHDGYTRAEKGSVVSLLTNGLLFFFKIAAGVLGRSTAMIADAFDTLGDCMTSIGMLIGFRIAKKPADAEHPYGHGKAESIIAKILALFLIAFGVAVAYRSIAILVSGVTYVPSVIALSAAIISIAVKVALFRYTGRIGRTISSTAMTVYSWNMAADVFMSCAALVGIAGARMGVPALDPIAALIISVFVVRTGCIAFHRAYDELMDGAPAKAVTEGIIRVVRSNAAVRAVKDLKVRKMGLELMIDLTICVDRNLTVEKGHDITDLVRTDVLAKVPAAREVFIHVEPFTPGMRCL